MIKKNPTPKQVALLASIILSGAFTLFIVIMRVINMIDISLIAVLGLGFSLFLFSYLLINYFVKRFIYRRIKLIYKNIHRFKLSKQDKTSLADIDDDSIEKVEQEVEEWVEGQDREIQHLKTLEEYRRNFLGNISHELKTPIFNIQGYIHTLLDGGLYDEQINREYLKRAASNTERLQIIIEDLDTISKIESGEMLLDKQAFNIKDLVLSVFEDLEMIAKERKIQLVFKEGADNGFTVHADKEAIRRVLINLVTNSIKYSNEKGLTKVSFYDMDSNILVEVADNGLGISEEHLPHLFDRFYRVDKSRSRALGGSGLGLSIVKHIMEAHNQTINVRSTPGLGSTFGFTLSKA